MDVELSQELTGPYYSISDSILPSASALGNGALLWILLALTLCLKSQTRRAGLAVLIALIMSFLITNLTLKPLFDRLRPCAFERFEACRFGTADVFRCCRHRLFKSFFRRALPQ